MFSSHNPSTSMESINKLHESDSDESSTLSLRDLLLYNHGEPSSPPSDLSDFSFPLPPAAEETYTTEANLFFHGHLLPNNFAPSPKLPPFNHRRAESLDGNNGEVKTVDYQQLRRACSDPRPTQEAARWKRWPLFVLGSMKFPAVMEMSDMRSRQRRRGPPEVDECGGRRSCWSVVRTLSCKAAETTAVPPLGATGGASVTSACRGIFGRK